MCDQETKKTWFLYQENFGQKKVSELRDSTLFLFVLYCLIHTGALESQTNYNRIIITTTVIAIYCETIAL